jgi:phosphoribosylglycinamide formyltransferase-1
MKRWNIAIFASGRGSNAENIIQYFAHHSDVKVAVVITNNANAGVVDRIKNTSVPVHFLPNEEITLGVPLLDILEEYTVDLVVLAGFLRKIPTVVIEHYPNRILNIHPALLPKYGGKGMYGIHVHEAVIGNKEKKSGITIHLVNEHYDEGAIIAQKETAVSANMCAEQLQEAIQKLEQKWYPEIIYNYLKIM